MDPIDLLEELVRVDSVNPAMGGPGEAEVAAYLEEVLRGLGLEVETPEVLPGRSNVVARLPGDPARRALLLEAHMDTVARPSDGLPLSRTDDRLAGRGACDTKGSCAAMVAALADLASEDGLGTIVFAGVVDEETTMSGSEALLGQIPAVDGAVVGEPTSLRPVRAHNGVLRFTVVAHGRSAHTSRAHLGVNAVTAAARLISALDSQLGPVLRARPHPVTGPALLTPAVVRGGVAPNVVPDRCEVMVDRRLAPGEEAGEALAEIDVVLERLRKGGDVITREEPFLVHPGVETPEDHPLVRAAERSVETVLGTGVVAGGVPFGTDASKLWGRGGIPCVVLGPGSIDQAHTDDEWVPLDEVRRAVDIYAEVVRRFAAEVRPSAGPAPEEAP